MPYFGWLDGSKDFIGTETGWVSPVFWYFAVAPFFGNENGIPALSSSLSLPNPEMFIQAASHSKIEVKADERRCLEWDAQLVRLRVKKFG